MKIAFVLTQSLDSPTGIGRIEPLAHELTQLGHQVEIFALHPGFDTINPKSYISEGVYIKYVACMHVIKKNNQKYYYSTGKLLQISINAIWQLSRAVMKTSADVIHVCKPHPMNGIAGIIARVLKNKLVFVDCDDYEAGSGNFQHLWQRWIVAFFERLVPKIANIVTTNTLFMRDKLISWGVSPDKIYYLPNGIKQSRFAQPDSKVIEALQTELGITGKKVVSFIGSLSLSSHPVDLLIEAFAWVHKTYPDSILLIVGGGEDLDNLRKQAIELNIQDAIHFTGRIPSDQVVTYYWVSHVSIDPIYDNDAARGRSPLKMFESWACKIPFITADVGDRRLLMGDPPAGLLIQPGDPLCLAQAIQQIIIDRKTSRTLVQSGIRNVKKFYWNRLAKNMETVYKAVIEKHQ